MQERPGYCWQPTAILGRPRKNRQMASNLKCLHSSPDPPAVVAAETRNATGILLEFLFSVAKL